MTDNPRSFALSADASCATCAFADAPGRGEDPIRRCRRHAPVVQFQRAWRDDDHGKRKHDRYLTEATAIWPEVNGEADWCGEWTKRSE